MAVAHRRRDAARPRAGARPVDEAYRDELSSASQLDPPKVPAPTPRATARRSCLIAALMTRADLLLLDEPTSGLDPLMEQVFRRAHPRGQGGRPDGVPVVAHPQRGRGLVRSDRDPAERSSGRCRHAGATCATSRRCRSRPSWPGRRPTCRHVPGVSAVELDGNRVRCQVSGTMEPLLDALSAVRRDAASSAASRRWRSCSWRTTAMSREAPRPRGPLSSCASRRCRAVRPGAIWGAVFGFVVAASATAYDASFPTAASRRQAGGVVRGQRRDRRAARTGPAARHGGRLHRLAHDGHPHGRGRGVGVAPGHAVDAGRGGRRSLGAAPERANHPPSGGHRRHGGVGRRALGPLGRHRRHRRAGRCHVQCRLRRCPRPCSWPRRSAPGRPCSWLSAWWRRNSPTRCRRANVIAAAVLGVSFLVRLVADSASGLSACCAGSARSAGSRRYTR